MGMGIIPGDVYLVDFEPTRGSEVWKKRPAIVVSPKSMNVWLMTVIIVPMTTQKKPWPSRVSISF